MPPFLQETTMIQIEEKNGKKIVTVERGRGTEVFLINATASDALIRHIFRLRDCESARLQDGEKTRLDSDSKIARVQDRERERSREDGSGGKESFTAEDIAALREQAREAGIRNWHTKKPENLVKEIEEKVNGDHT